MGSTRKIIEADCYYSKAQAGYVYTKQPQGAASRIQWDRLLNAPSSAYWRTKAQTYSERIKKKIILSDYWLGRCDLTQGAPKEYNEIFSTLSAMRFELYFMNNDGLLTLLDREKQQDADYWQQLIANSYLVRKELIEEQLLKKGEDIEQYCIFDNYYCMPMLKLHTRKENCYSIFIDEADVVHLPEVKWFEQTCCVDEAKLLSIDIMTIENKVLKQFLLAFLAVAQRIERVDFAIAEAKTLPNLVDMPIRLISLAGCKNLQEIPRLPLSLTAISLGHTAIKDCSPLALSPLLSYLYLAYTAIEDYSPLKRLKVKDLSLQGCQNIRNLIENYHEIGASIEVLNLSETAVTSLPDFSKTPLKILRLSKCCEVVLPASFPATLEELDLSESSVNKVPDLSNTKLKEINLSGCQAITILPVFPQSIETINLYGTRISDLSDLAKYPHLKQVELSDGQLKAIPALPEQVKIFVSEPSHMPTDSSSGEVKSYAESEQKRPQSLRSASSLTLMDIHTKVEPTQVVKATYGIYKKDQLSPLEPSAYRQEVKDCFTRVYNQFALGQAEVKYTDPQLESVSYSTEDFLASLAEENYFVKFPVGKSKEWISLPLLSANDQITRMHQPKESELRYNSERNQYEIKLNGPATTVQYVVAPAQEMKIAIPVIPVLPAVLQSQFDKLLRVIPSGASSNLAALLEQLIQLKPAQKWDFCNNALAAYCRQFANENLSPLTADWDPCLRMLIEQKGACRHRAFVYMVVCNYLKIPARYIENEIHAYVEIFDGKNWQKVDLGGAESVLDFKPSLLFSAKIAPDKQAEHWDRYFMPKTVQQKEYKNLEAVLSDLAQQHATLLTVEDTEAARSLYMAMAEHTEGLLVYLESARDMEENWQAVQIGENGSLKKQVPGPLYEAIKKGGTLIINWDNFSANEMASYKSLMDNPPTFFGEPVSEHLHLINIVTPQMPTCSAFLSRCKKFTWPESIAYPNATLPLEEQPMAEEKALSPIDLYGNEENWRERLLGEAHYTDQGFAFKPGKLLEAILSKQEKVVLVDAPLDDPHFQRFIHQLLVQRRFFVNGESYEVPADFTIHFAPAPQTVTPPEPLQEQKEYSSEESDIFYLNAQTLPLLFKQQVLKNHKMVSVAGWLAQPPTKKRCLVQTEPLTLGEERQLYQALEEQKETIGYVDFTQQEPKPTSSLDSWDGSQITKNCLIETDDPHFVASELAQQAALTMPIHAQTDVADLIETIEMKADSWDFTHQMGVVAEALLKGKTVILHGSLSADLYQALEPLFSATPQLKLATGEKATLFPGKLCIVTTPLTFPVAVANSHGSQLQVSADALWERYAAKIAPAEKECFEKIRFFYQLAATVTHGKTGTPPMLRMNDKRLQQMLAVLRTKATNDNPIKMFFHYDYDKTSEDYAYLNVMAKVLFGQKDQARGCRQDKQGRYPENDSHFWRRLNCLNASALKVLLPSTALLSPDKDQISQNLRKLTTENIPSSSNSHKKAMDRMQSHLQTGQAVVLKGPPGSGKTFLAFAYAKAKGKGKFFFGDTAVQAWQESKAAADAESVLIMDEANLTAAHFEFLAKLPQSPHHKVIFTCNPESYPGRCYQPDLQDLPTVYVNKWTRAELKELLLDFLKKIPAFQVTEHIAAIDSILTVYLSLEKILPPDTLSLRDLQTVAWRFCYQLPTKAGPTALAYQACVAEWGNSFDDAIVDRQFQALLAQEFPNVTATPRDETFLQELPKDYYLSNQHRTLLLQIYHDFQLAEATKTYNEIDGAPPVKLGVLLEGASGVGKSALMRTLLETLKYKELTAEQLLESKAANLSDCFIHFTVTHHSMQDALLLQTAFDRGCKVILDELNLDPAIETLLNHLLTGKTPEGKSATQKGFFVFASQNSVTMEGRQTVSKALKNRFHTLYVKETTAADLQQIAKQALPVATNKNTQEMVKSYVHQAQLHPQAVNMRTFFDGLALIKKHFLAFKRRNGLFPSAFSQDKVFAAQQTAQQERPLRRASL